jgi:HK97 family phage major capsid protein
MHTADANISEILLHGMLTNNSEQAARAASLGSPAKYYEQVKKERGASRSLDAMLGLPAREMEGYSLVRAAASLLPEARDIGRFERDVDAYVTSRTGAVANGIRIPLGLLGRDFNVGTASEAGNLIGVNRYTDVSGDPIRPVTVLGALPCTVLHGLTATSSVPMFNSTTTPSVVTETGAATSVLETTNSIDLSPYTVRVIVEASRQAMLQSSADLNRGLPRQLSAALFNKVEQVVLAGTGSGGEPTGIVRSSSVNVVSGGTDGLALAWSHLAAMEKGANAANIAPGAGAFITNAKVMNAMRTTTRGTNLDYLMPENRALGYPVLCTNNVPSDLSKGTGSNLSAAVFCNDWSQLLLAFFGGGVDLTIDPITKADQGTVRIVASLTFSFGMMRPTAFSVMKDIIAV